MFLSKTLYNPMKTNYLQGYPIPIKLFKNILAMISDLCLVEHNIE